MSRLAKKPIQLPAKVEVSINGPKALVKGPKGQIEIFLHDGVNVSVKESNLFIEESEALQHKPFLGLTYAQFKNAIMGVVSAYEKKLELVGIGYKVALKGNSLDFALGFSHPLQVEIPKGLEVKVEKNVSISITGVDKQVVGQFAASIRSLKPPEPYKQKGIRYHNEVVRKKAGKTAK
jgi:large subunit ribosomal protein L6